VFDNDSHKQWRPHDGHSNNSHKQWRPQSFNSCMMMNFSELLSLSILWPSLTWFVPVTAVAAVVYNVADNDMVHGRHCTGSTPRDPTVLEAFFLLLKNNFNTAVRRWWIWWTETLAIIKQQPTLCQNPTTFCQCKIYFQSQLTAAINVPYRLSLLQRIFLVQKTVCLACENALLPQFLSAQQNGNM